MKLMVFIYISFHALSALSEDLISKKYLNYSIDINSLVKGHINQSKEKIKLNKISAIHPEFSFLSDYFDSKIYTELIIIKSSYITPISIDHFHDEKDEIPILFKYLTPQKIESLEQKKFKIPSSNLIFTLYFDGEDISDIIDRKTSQFLSSVQKTDPLLSRASLVSYLKAESSQSKELDFIQISFYIPILEGKTLVIHYWFFLNSTNLNPLYFEHLKLIKAANK